MTVVLGASLLHRHLVDRAREIEFDHNFASNPIGTSEFNLDGVCRISSIRPMDAEVAAVIAVQEHIPSRKEAYKLTGLFAQAGVPIKKDGITVNLSSRSLQQLQRLIAIRIAEEISCDANGHRSSGYEDRVNNRIARLFLFRNQGATNLAL